MASGRTGKVAELEGPLAAPVGLLFGRLIERYVRTEDAGLKAAAEATPRA